MRSHDPASGGKSLRLPEYPGTLVMGCLIAYRSSYPLQGNTPLREVDKIAGVWYYCKVIRAMNPA